MNILLLIFAGLFILVMINSFFNSIRNIIKYNRKKKYYPFNDE